MTTQRSSSGQDPDHSPLACGGTSRLYAAVFPHSSHPGLWMARPGGALEAEGFPTFEAARDFARAWAAADPRRRGYCVHDAGGRELERHPVNAPMVEGFVVVFNDEDHPSARFGPYPTEADAKTDLEGRLRAAPGGSVPAVTFRRWGLGNALRFRVGSCQEPAYSGRTGRIERGRVPAPTDYSNFYSKFYSKEAVSN